MERLPEEVTKFFNGKNMMIIFPDQFGDSMDSMTFAQPQHTEEVSAYDIIRKWIQTKEVYTVRFAIGMLMRYYLDGRFSLEYPEIVASVRSEEYYIRMMIAWYFATALAKQYDAVLPFLEKKALEDWTHNKAIQKSLESYRITPEQKVYLKTLKVPARGKQEEEQAASDH
jgi:3-methyladenine DNA glycosylase AlkD